MTDKRLIDANALVDKVSLDWGLTHQNQLISATTKLATADAMCKLLGEVAKCQTIDAVEVVHGRWENATVEAYFVPTIEEKTKRDFPCCSRCHQIQSIAAWTNPFNYCPNCGAKMDAKEDKPCE